MLDHLRHVPRSDEQCKNGQRPCGVSGVSATLISASTSGKNDRDARSTGTSIDIRVAWALEGYIGSLANPLSDLLPCSSTSLLWHQDVHSSISIHHEGLGSA